MPQFRVRGHFYYGPQPDEKTPFRMVTLIREADTEADAAQHILADYALDFPGARWLPGNPFVNKARRRKVKPLSESPDNLTTNSRTRS